MDESNPRAPTRATRHALLTLPELAAMLLALNSTAFAKDISPIPANESILGVTQVELTKNWWRWAASFPQNSGPIADRTGAQCGKGQRGDVWFLAGAYGSQRVTRTCHVPAGKTLFFPLINFVMYWQRPNYDCKELILDAASATNRPSALILEIDGMRFFDLDSHRLATDCFSLAPDRPPAVAANGYYIAIRPPSKGKHVFNFGGILPDITQAITYTIIVE